MELNPALVDQQYQKYLAEKAKKTTEEAELEAQRQALKATIKAKVEATRLNQIHTAKKEYLCECCGKLIPEGTRYRRQNIPNGSGWPEGVHFIQRVTHLVCSVEAKKQ